MRVAVLGLGSIGRRHAEIVCHLGHETIGFDPSPDAPSIDGLARASSERAAVAAADAVIVASPPSEHLRQARLALEHGAHVLVEKPFAPSAVGLAELGALARERALVLGAAMNLRFHPGVRTAHRLLTQGAIGRPLRASIWFGSWLPGWRPGSDYRNTYSAQRAQGGGVLLDAIHEVDYALWLLGPAVRVRALLSHESSLELDVEDIATLILEHACGAVTNITLDYLDHAYHRGCRLVGEEGTISWSWEREELLIHPARGEPERIVIPSAVAPSYRAELESFLEAALRGKMPASGVEEAAAALSVVDAARLACEEGIAVEVRPRGLALRPAASEDAQELLRWRNDRETRLASFHGEEVATQEHLAWLARTLADPSRHLLIAIAGGSSVGQLRLDRIGEDSFELHIGLAPEARGRGLGAELLALAIREHAIPLGARRVLAHIKPHNETSMRSFRKAGFRPDEEVPEQWWLSARDRG